MKLFSRNHTAAGSGEQEHRILVSGGYQPDTRSSSRRASR